MTPKLLFYHDEIHQFMYIAYDFGTIHPLDSRM